MKCLTNEKILNNVSTNSICQINDLVQLESNNLIQVILTLTLKYIMNKKIWYTWMVFLQENNAFISQKQR